MTSADRRARTSRGGRPAPRAMRPSDRCAGCGRAGRRTGARRRGRFSRTAPRPSGSHPTAGRPARRPFPSASSTGVPARSAPSTVRRPVAPQRDGLPKAWRGKRPDSQRHDWLRGGVPYPDGAFHVLTDQGVLHDEGEAQGLDTPVRAWRLAGRNRSGRIQNGALRRLGDGAVAGALDLPGDVLRGDAETDHRRRNRREAVAR